MTDNFEKSKRSEIMSRIRSHNTKPELVVRSLLHRAGYRFCLHRADLPGKPDIALPKFNTVVFVHGCFWHQHRGCKRATTPKSHKKYWGPKLKRNIERFKEVAGELQKRGWRVIVVWECETRYVSKLGKKLDLIFKKRVIYRSALEV